MWRRLLTGLQAVDQLLDLVDDAAVGRGPGPPPLAIDRPQLTLGVGPFVPDADAVVLQIGDVGLAAQEPQQFHDDGAQMQFLGRQDRKALGQVEPHLATEHAERSGAGAVIAPHAVVQDVAHQVQILTLGMIGRREDAGLNVGAERGVDHLDGHGFKVHQISDSRSWQIGVFHRIDSGGQAGSSSHYRSEGGRARCSTPAVILGLVPRIHTLGPEVGARRWAPGLWSSAQGRG